MLQQNDKLPVYGAVLNGENIFELEKIKTGIIVIGNEGKGISEQNLELLTKIHKAAPNQIVWSWIAEAAAQDGNASIIEYIEKEVPNFSHWNTVIERAAARGHFNIVKKATSHLKARPR